MARQKVMGPLPKYINAVTDEELAEAVAGAGGGGGGQSCEMSTESAYRTALTALVANGSGLTVDSHSIAQLAYPAFGDLVRHSITATPAAPGKKNININYNPLYELNEGYDAVPLQVLATDLAGNMIPAALAYNGSQIQVHFQAEAAEQYAFTVLVIVAVTNKCDD